MKRCTYCDQYGHTAGSCPRRGAVGWHIASAAAIAATLLMLGCSGQPVPPSQIRQPATRLMAAPEPLPTVMAGDDLVYHYLALRRQYSRETARLKSLQGYVRLSRGG
jgi:hypothetical protein